MNRLILILILLLSFRILCTAQENKFNKACKINTIEAYDEFLGKYPISEYTEQAIFRKALLINTSEAFRGFLDKYPTGNYSRQADSIMCWIEFKKIQDSDDQAVWEEYFNKYRNSPLYGTEIENKLIMVKYRNAEKYNTKNAYRAFIDLYPDCEYSIQAERNIQKIEFEDLRKENSIKKIKNYIAAKPGGYFIPDIKDYLDSLEFDLAVDSGSADSINIFLSRYPTTKFKDEARQKLEELDFLEVKKIHTIEAYDQFLVRYPSGQYAEIARTGIAQINYYNEPDVRKLQSSDLQVVRNAIIELGATENPLAVEPLIAVYKDRDIFTKEIAEALVNIGDSAVQPLIDLVKIDDFYYGEAADAVWALGELGDKRAVQSLVDVLDNYYYQEIAADALGKINDTTIIPQLINDLFDGDYGDDGIALALAKMNAKQAIPIMVDNLTTWERGKKVAGPLLELGWKPVSIQDQVHLWVARKDWSDLKTHWEDSRFVLLEDANSSKPYLVENAVYAFISIGKKEIIPDLKSILYIQGTVSIAETYLNCGNGELEDAARIWAEDHGYTVSSDYGGGGSASWGGN